MSKFESLTAVKCKLQAEFGKQIPSLDCIKNVFERFTETGTVEDRERSGRPSDYYRRDSRKSSRCLWSWTKAKCSNSSSCLCHPKDHSASNYERAFIDKPIQGTFCSTVVRRRFSRFGWTCAKPWNRCYWMSTMKRGSFFPTKAAFHLNDLINKHNVRYWCETNPSIQLETVMKSPKVNVWCAMIQQAVNWIVLLRGWYCRWFKVPFRCFKNFSFQKWERWKRCALSYFSRMELLLILQLM